MGIDWFFKKLEKYKIVRTKMAMEGSKIDGIVEQELERFQEDEERAQRMKKREEEIKQERSEVRKAILKAKQFVDEFS